MPSEAEGKQMQIRPIKTEQDYDWALKEIEGLMDAQPDTPEGDRLNVLVTLVEAYEAQHFPVGEPDPIEAIRERMEDLHLTRKELEELIGPRGRVSEILTRKRPLTIHMIRRIHKAMRIPVEILIQPYKTRKKPA